MLGSKNEQGLPLMEAWREVARRIAHEIKNPLTPIQLAAQRLRRRFGAQLHEDGAVFEECTRTIVQQVEELKGLVNEFSTFARMPQAEHRPCDLNALVDEALVLFREGHREIDFTFDTEPEPPVIELDRDGMGRATPILGHEGPGHELIPGLNNVYDARAFLFGGGEIGPHTLLRFYILHCIFIPLVTSLFLAVHFWRIRRDGFSGPAL